METTIIVAIITALGTIINTIISKKTNKKVTSLQEHILDSDKTYLTDYISDIENGLPKTDIQKKRAHEIHERYVKNGGNSYIQDKWEESREKGLL